MDNALSLLKRRDTIQVCSAPSTRAKIEIHVQMRGPDGYKHALKPNCCCCTSVLPRNTLQKINADPDTGVMPASNDWCI